MKTTLSVYDFRDAFQRAGRSSQFSYEALGVLFDFFEEYEESTGEEIELDVIGICCDFVEMTPKEVIKAYDLDIEDDGNELNNVLDHLNDHTILVGKTCQGTIVFQQY